MLALAQKLGLPTAPIHNVIEGSGDKRDIWVVAEFEGNLLGFCHCVRGRQANPLMKVKLFAIAKSVLEYGFGWAMMRYVEAIASSENARLIWLDGITLNNWEPWEMPNLGDNENISIDRVYNPSAAPVREASWYGCDRTTNISEAA